MPIGEEDLVQAVNLGKKVIVQMWGSTSGHVTGYVNTLLLYFFLQDGTQQYLFENQLEISLTKVGDGDSGSLILTDDFKIGGLLFAIRDDGWSGAVGVANPWEAVKHATSLTFEY
jgi:hypothetical protein